MKSRTQLSDFTFTFHFHALEKEMATHSSVLAWRIPGMGEPGGLLSMGLHRVRHDWSDLAAAAAFPLVQINLSEIKILVYHSLVQIVNRSLLLMELILGLCNSQQNFLKLPLTWSSLLLMELILGLCNSQQNFLKFPLTWSFTTSLCYFYTSIKWKLFILTHYDLTVPSSWNTPLNPTHLDMSKFHSLSSVDSLKQVFHF